MGDVLLRLAFAWLSFVASSPPPQLGCDRADQAEATTFISPVVSAMTAAEWDIVVRLRAANERAFKRILRLLATDTHSPLCKLLSDLEGMLANGGPAGPSQGLLGTQLAHFITFARSECDTDATSSVCAAS